MQIRSKQCNSNVLHCSLSFRSYHVLTKCLSHSLTHTHTHTHTRTHTHTHAHTHSHTHTDTHTHTHTHTHTLTHTHTHTHTHSHTHTHTHRHARTQTLGLERYCILIEKTERRNKTKSNVYTLISGRDIKIVSL
jgi:hypothetical protein